MKQPEISVQMKRFTITWVLFGAIMMFFGAVRADTAPKTAPSTIGSRPHAPAGFVAVLRPGAKGNYWVLVPVSTDEHGVSPANSHTNPTPRDDMRPEPVDTEDVQLPAPAELATNLELLERDIVDETNARRSEAGLPPLQPHPVLEQAARSHSESMAKTGVLSHDEETHERKTVVERTKLAGASGWSKIAENVAMGRFPEPIARSISQTFYESDAHRANLLDPKQELIGIGVVTDGQTLYVTQVFAANLALSPQPQGESTTPVPPDETR